MPSEQGGYFAQLQKETDDAKKAETDLSDRGEPARGARPSNCMAIEAISAAGGYRPTIGGGTHAVGGDTLSRIQETQAKLDELLLKYTDKHPDVIATRATLEELKKRRAAELESLRRGDASAVAASGAGNNPVYQSMQLELNKVDVEIAALRRELAQHQSTVAELRQRLNSAPQVEAEFQQLNRDYDVNKAQYTALLESYQKARLGERADNAGSVRFEIVLPPTAPVVPVWPKRTSLLAEIWMARWRLGAGLAYALHVMRPIVSSMRGVNEITPLSRARGGERGLSRPASARRLSRQSLGLFCSGSGCLVLAFGVVLVLNWSGARLDSCRFESLVNS